MSEYENFTDEVMRGLRDKGFVIVTDEFINQLITTLHMNVNAINVMAELANIQRYSLAKELKELSVRIADIAFSVEGVRDDQQG